jgi:hypothetical protein
MGIEWKRRGRAGESDIERQSITPQTAGSHHTSLDRRSAAGSSSSGVKSSTELRPIDPECSEHPIDGVHTRMTPVLFDETHESPMDPGEIRQRLLRKARFHAERSEAGADG